MSIPRNWRVRQQRYSLKAEVCNTCNKTIFPPRDVCPHCAEQKQSWTNLSGRGEVYSFTTMFNAPAGSRSMPRIPWRWSSWPRAR